jgi:hypothetical protein
MDTFALAREFAGIAAEDIIGHLRPTLPEAEIAEAAQLIRECCAAAIAGALIQQRSAARSARRNGSR